LSDGDDFGQRDVQRMRYGDALILQELPQNRIGIVEKTDFNLVQLAVERSFALNPRLKAELLFERGLNFRCAKATAGKEIEIV
jgi:hypothetical protein